MENINNRNINIGEHNLVYVYPEEQEFFDNFLNKNNIKWTKEQREASIIALSKSLTGYINTPIRKIEIPTKYKEININHILRLYNYVYSYRGVEDDELLEISVSEQAENLVENFLNNLKSNISIGILQEYTLNHAQLSYLKGHVDFVDTYKNVLLQKKQPVVTDIYKLSMNININQLIVGALNIITKTNKSNSLAQDLLGYYDNVMPITKDASEFLKVIMFNSKNNRYKKIASDAAMIIDSLYYDDKKGSAGGESFLINFDLLFENFIIKILVEETSKREFSTLVKPLTLGTVYTNGLNIKNNFYKPDLLYKYLPEDPNYGYKPSAYATIDVKNKANAIFKNQDIYQISLYTKMLYSQKSILIYPAFQRKLPDFLLLDNIELNVPKIIAIYIDITKEKAGDFKKEIDIFIKDIYENIESN